MKKIFTVLSAIALLMSLAACTDTSASETTAPTEPPLKTVYVHSSITQEFGSTVSRTEYVFDEQDRVKEVVVYTNDTETKRHSVECDENGNYIRWTSDGSVMEYTYNDHGHNLGMTMFIDGEQVSSTEYVWTNGLRTSVTTKMAAQNIAQKVLMTYDSKGLLLRQDSYTADTLSSYSIYAYGENGRVKSMTTYLPDGTLYTVSTHAWQGNAQTIVTADAEGAVMQTAVLTYDDAKNLLTHTVYNALGDQVSKETHTWKALQVDPNCPRASV